MNKRIIFLLLSVFLVLLCSNVGVFAEPAEPATSASIYVNNNRIEILSSPSIDNDLLMLPIKPVFEALKAEISLYDSHRAIIKFKGKKVIFRTGKTDAYVDTECILLESPATFYEGEIYIPASFLAEAFDAEIIFDEYTGKLHINCDDGYINPQYDEVKRILEQTYANMSSLKSYTTTSSIYLWNNTQDSENMSPEITIKSKINVQDKISHVSYTFNDASSDYSSTYDIWLKDNYSYKYASGENEWIIEYHPDEEIEAIFDLSKNLKVLFVSESLYNNLSVRYESNGKIILEGTGNFKELLLSIVDDGLFNNTDDLFNSVLSNILGSARIRYIIDSQSYILESLDLAIEYPLMGGEIRSNDQFSDINKPIQINLPDEAVRLKENYSKALSYVSKAESAFNEGRYDNCIHYSGTALSIYPKTVEAYIYKVRALIAKEEYEKAIEFYEKLNEQFPKDSDLYTLIAECYYHVGDMTKAYELCSQAARINPKNHKAYNIAGLVCLYNEDYTTALNAFEYAIQLNNDFYEAYENKMHTLYLQANYNKCIEFSKEVEELFGETYDTCWYRAACLERQYKFRQAIRENRKLLKIQPDAYNIISDIAWDYYYDGEYGLALLYNKKALALNNEYPPSLYLETLLEYEMNTPMAKRIADFVRANYLYKKDVSGFENKCDAFAAKGDSVTVSEIEKFIKSITVDSDEYTMFISADDYASLTNHDSSKLFFAETHAIIDNTEYIRLFGFNNNVSVQFNEYLHSIENPEDTYLILDLRYNTGGVTEACNRMLDLLLPNCVTSYLIDRDGYISTYESDNYNIKFKHIFILVNSSTASCGEMFTMSLQRYLDNVTIVGEETHGKGVGQVVYVDKKSQYAIYLVGHYWNVGEQNVQNKSVVPDIVLRPDQDPYVYVIIMIAAGEY